MATKDYSSRLKSKQGFVFHSNGQYKNFNLKQKNSSNTFSESSKNVSSENRKVLNYAFGSIDVIEKESGGKISCSSSITNSTLSLHIEAYENSTVSGLFDGTEKSLKQNGLIRGNAKQLFTVFESVIQNPFEFPRQQENVKAKTPEVAQYTASQRLLNPNQNKKLQTKDSEMDVTCADCDQKVEGRALFVEEKVYHRNHFHCSECQLSIRHFYYLSSDEKPLCYSCKSLQHPLCKRCNTFVGETFIRAENQCYHLDCFVCSGCNKPFPGGEYVIHDSKPYDINCFWGQTISTVTSTMPKNSTK